jgi:predicted CoA-substrate-specific enzyme activase
MLYTCKYAPVELFAGFGEDCIPIDEAPEDFELAESIVHPNICGFGKAIVQAAAAGSIDEIVLVNCCDTMRRTYEVLESLGRCSFVHLIDLPHCADGCAVDGLTRSLDRLRSAYAEYSGRAFDEAAFHAALASQQAPKAIEEPYIGIMGVRASGQLIQSATDTLPLPVKNLTCLGLRDLHLDPSPNCATAPGDLRPYAAALLRQIPCTRMADPSSRRHLTEDPRLRGIVYHTIRFCDYYGSECADLASRVDVPFLRIESDFTEQGEGQLRTRIEAFAEGFAKQPAKGTTMARSPKSMFVAGIDSGSTSTDVVVMDRNRRIAASAIIPTHGSATASAERSLQEALAGFGISRESIGRIVSTGYGRDAIGGKNDSVTEITCHAKGAHYLDPSVRTIIDIGGQDSKAIGIDGTGAVRNFAMNDKCAAGTGRFLEMMARTLGIGLDEMSVIGLSSKREVVISSTCSVFAESEVVSLVARDIELADIVAAIDRSVAAKTASLAKRVGIEDSIMMTGGVAKNVGVVRAIEKKLGRAVAISDSAQLCGAIGAALLALE